MIWRAKRVCRGWFGAQSAPVGSGVARERADKGWFGVQSAPGKTTCRTGGLKLLKDDVFGIMF